MRNLVHACTNAGCPIQKACRGRGSVATSPTPHWPGAGQTLHRLQPALNWTGWAAWYQNSPEETSGTDGRRAGSVRLTHVIANPCRSAVEHAPCVVCTHQELHREAGPGSRVVETACWLWQLELVAALGCSAYGTSCRGQCFWLSAEPELQHAAGLAPQHCCLVPKRCSARRKGPNTMAHCHPGEASTSTTLLPQTMQVAL